MIYFGGERKNQQGEKNPARGSTGARAPKKKRNIGQEMPAKGKRPERKNAPGEFQQAAVVLVLKGRNPEFPGGKQNEYLKLRWGGGKNLFPGRGEGKKLTVRQAPGIRGKSAKEGHPERIFSWGRGEEREAGGKGGLHG